MFRPSFSFFRPGARSWRSKTSNVASSHFSYVSDHQRQQHLEQKKKMMKESDAAVDSAINTIASAAVTGGSLSSSTSKQQKQKIEDFTASQKNRKPLGQSHQEQLLQREQVADEEASRVASRGGSLMSMWQAINPTRNIDHMAKKPWLRRAVVWARTIKLAEFAHISYFLGPSFVGCAFACTVAVVKESCDTLALQLPFIPLHCMAQSLLLLWASTSVGYIAEAVIRKQVYKDDSVQMKGFDAVGAFTMHLLSAFVLLLWHQWIAVQVALCAAPLIVFHIVARAQLSADEEAARRKKFQPSSSSSSTTTTTSISQQQQKTVTASVVAGSAGEGGGGGEEEINQQKQVQQDRKSRMFMVIDSLLVPIPILISYSSLLGRLDPSITIPLSVAGICWGACYHSFGGGEKALFVQIAGRKRIKIQLMGLAMLSYVSLNVAGYFAGQTLFYYVALGWSFFHLLGVIDHFRPGDAWSVMTARRRLRMSVWLVFLACVVGNFLWLFLVAAVSQIKDIESEQQQQQQQKEDKKQDVAVATATSVSDVSSSSSASSSTVVEEDTDKLLEGDNRAPVGETKKTKTGSTLAKVLTLTIQPSPHTSMDEFSWLERIAKPILVFATVQANNQQNLNNEQRQEEEQQQQKRVTTVDADLQIPVFYRREFFGENFAFIMRNSAIFSEDQVKKFETKYIAMLDHYSPYGSI